MRVNLRSLSAFLGFFFAIVMPLWGLLSPHQFWFLGWKMFSRPIPACKVLEVKLDNNPLTAALIHQRLNSYDLGRSDRAFYVRVTSEGRLGFLKSLCSPTVAQVRGKFECYRLKTKTWQTKDANILCRRTKN